MIYVPRLNTVGNVKILVLQDSPVEMEVVYAFALEKYLPCVETYALIHKAIPIIAESVIKAVRVIKAVFWDVVRVRPQPQRYVHSVQPRTRHVLSSVLIPIPTRNIVEIVAFPVHTIKFVSRVDVKTFALLNAQVSVDDNALIYEQMCCFVEAAIAHVQRDKFAKRVYVSVRKQKRITVQGNVDYCPTIHSTVEGADTPVNPMKSAALGVASVKIAIG
ncbi:MAG: hypothetical protein AAGJ35_10485 [Myxococcota bacterium]